MLPTNSIFEYFNSDLITILKVIAFDDSTRVSNELGAGKINKAKNAMVVTLKLSILLAALVLLVLGLGHNIWAGFFSGSANIIKAYASITPLICISIFFDSIQGVLSGTNIVTF